MKKRHQFSIITLPHKTILGVSFMSIITEEMRAREKMCQFAQKYGVTKAARRYKTNRQFVYRQLAKYDGSLKSLKLRSRRPHSHPKQHTSEEIDQITRVYKRYAIDGLAEVYAQLIKRAYSRCFSSMKKMIHQHIKQKAKKKRPYKKNNQGPKQTKTFPGELVQVDIKYVPKQCIMWDTKGISYYQITAIDTFSSKRVLKIVDEKSMTHTSTFLLDLEERFGFPIQCIQTDNGSEFLSVHPNAKGLTLFQTILKTKGIKHIHTRPYSPWQNGIVERSHRIDGERFYMRQSFKSKEDLVKKHKRYTARYNNIAKQKHQFLSPNQVVEKYQQEQKTQATG